MVSIYPTTVPTKRLSASITASSSSFTLNNIEGWNGSDLTSADFGTLAYAVFRNTDGTLMEIIEFDPSTIASAAITITRRGLKFTGDLTTEVTANKLTWIRNDTLVELGTDVPQLLKHYIDDVADQSISGIKTFSESTMPRISTAHTYVAGEEERLATKRYVDGVVASGAPDATTTAKGLAEEATEAEIEAGTAAGSAARLFVNPNTLKSSDYGTGIYNRTNDYAADAGSNDTYVITLTPALAAYTAGATVRFKANTRNTGACTINVNGLGAKSIKKEISLDPADGDIESGGIYQLVYDGTNFQLMNPKGSIPTGSIHAWATATAPAGYVLCDGSAISRTTYATLFAVISTQFGTGDGSTTFNVPNMKGKVIVGYNASETEFDAVGETGGEKTHVLTASEMPSHTHTVGIQGTSKGYSGSGNLADSGGNSTTSSAGSDAAHNNLQPYIAVCYIIKI